MTRKKNVAIIGLAGRMGQLIYKELLRHPAYGVQGGFDKVTPEHGMLYSSLEEALDHSDYVVDFSSPSLTSRLITASLKNPKPLIIGTTGLDNISLSPLDQKVPVVLGSNTNLTTYLQRHLACQLASMLNDGYDIDISEQHHRYKEDDFSGTALDLAKAIACVKNEQKKKDTYSWGPVHSPRPSYKIHLTAHRSGQIPGTHEIRFTSDDETISITHTVFNRTIFAKGLVKILDWMTSSRPLAGLYSMDAVFQYLNLKKNIS